MTHYDATTLACSQNKDVFPLVTNSDKAPQPAEAEHESLSASSWKANRSREKLNARVPALGLIAKLLVAIRSLSLVPAAPPPLPASWTEV